MSDIPADGTDNRSSWEVTRAALESNFDMLPRSTSVGFEPQAKAPLPLRHGTVTVAPNATCATT